MMASYSNDMSTCFSCYCHFLSADSFPLGSPQVNREHQVSFWKVSSPHVLLMTDIYSQSIRSTATACNKSHLAGPWASPQASPELATTDKHGCLANLQASEWPRSIRFSHLISYSPKRLYFITLTCSLIYQRWQKMKYSDLTFDF